MSLTFARSFFFTRSTATNKDISFVQLENLCWSITSAHFSYKTLDPRWNIVNSGILSRDPMQNIHQSTMLKLFFAEKLGWEKSLHSWKFILPQKRQDCMKSKAVSVTLGMKLGKDMWVSQTNIASADFYFFFLFWSMMYQES